MNTEYSSSIITIEPTRKRKFILFSLLIILNLILRIPSIPHEKGTDSFLIHALSNSITTHGFANWWAHWLSAFGMYPYSYASAVPFSLSGISQTTGLDGVQMENTVLLYCILLGLFSIYTAYIFSGTIYNDFLFKYLMALIFSISQGVMIFSTWEVSARGTYVIFLPLFVFILLKRMAFVKTLLLIGLLGVFLAASHHFFWMAVPFVGVFIIVESLYNLSHGKIRYIKNSHNKYCNYIYIACIILIFSYPFLTQSMITFGSRYDYLKLMLIINTRWTGPLFILSFVGIVYLSLKDGKKFEEWYILLSLLPFVQLTYELIYGMYIVLIFTTFFISVVLKNIITSSEKIGSKAPIWVIIFSLLVFTSFSAYYNHERTENVGTSRGSWYMSDQTYQTGVWIDNHIDKDKHILTNTRNMYTVRTLAIQTDSTPIIIGDSLGLANGYIEKQFIDDNLTAVPITSSYFYKEGAYKYTVRDKFRDIGWYLESKHIKKIKDYYKCDYLFQDGGSQKPFGFDESNAGIIYTDGTLEVCDLGYI